MLNLHPIGTVVRLVNGTKRVMIIGYKTQNTDAPGKVYDYSGCLYPEGQLSSHQILLFDHDQIEEVYFIGYRDAEQQTFMEKLEKVLKSGAAAGAAAETLAVKK